MDSARDRPLPTAVYEPNDAEHPLPLIVFGHGFHGHPRKFTKLLDAWAAAGFVVAAPTFPLTNDEAAAEPVFEDVANQPADVRFVLDEVARDGRIDAERIGVAGFSLGAITALAVAFHTRHRDRRIRAVAALSGCFWPSFGGTYAMDDIPLLLLHGTADATVPYAGSEAVYEAARPPKALVALQDGLHHELFEDGFGPVGTALETTVAFWQLHLGGDASARGRLLASRPSATIYAEGV